VRWSRHNAAVRNFGAHDTFLPVRTFQILPLGVALAIAVSCVQPPPGYEPDIPPVRTPPVRTPPVKTPAENPAPVNAPPVNTPRVDTPPVNTPQVDVASDSTARTHLIDIRLVEPTFMVDARYATANNFTGAPLPGYESHRALLRREAAAALARVQRRARNEGVALKVFDGYRPVRATLAMVEWARSTGQQALLRDGYIASRSQHNLGLAVDLTLIGGDGKELDMGTPFDTFSSAAHTANATGEVASNRRLLVLLMQAEGFKNYEKEWWHFTYEVPNPLRFDLVIR
jgi:zinc D-Ala-D-Ala dipeptidase